MPRLARLLLLALSLSTVAAAQRPEVRTDTLSLDAVVVTATPTARVIEDMAVPITVVDAAEIRQQGAVRLSDVLEAVPGLFLSDDHGTGLQVQGFAADYTLILIDGEPIIGRMAGTLNLDRLSVAGLSRVEVVRGPTSSLYGSDALAGVVNLVTSLPREGASGEVRARGGSFRTSDLTVSGGMGRSEGTAGDWAVRAMLNRYASSGYDLTPEAFGPTAPAFADWTADVRSRLDLGRGAVLRVGARASAQDQAGAFALPSAAGQTEYDDTGARVDWSVHPEIEVPLSQRLRLTTTLYGARYTTEVRQREALTGSVYYTDDFDQRYSKAETQLDALWSTRHATTFGAGAIDERLGGDRYDGDRPIAQQVFAFGQHTWAPSPRVEVAASARFDAHTAYAARVTPKVSLLYRASPSVRLRASIGSGFKAPDFRQIYLAFTNAAAGYSVFGSTRLADGLARLQAEGQIEQTFLDPATLGAIEAESSVAYQAGLSAQPARWLTLDAGLFLNNVRDLIDSLPVALKTNGQFVFGYFNVDRIYTRGFDVQATVRPLAGVEVGGGYQYLQARDRSVVDALGAGSVFGRDADGREYRLSLADYGGLFGRSPHALTLRAGVQTGGWGANARARWRSQYGYRDLDGNGVANRPDEFVPAYAVVDLTLTRTWDRVTPVVGASRVTLQAGVDNLFGITHPTLVPSLPGRALYASVGFSF